MSAEWGASLSPSAASDHDLGARAVFAEAAWFHRTEAAKLVGAIGQLELEIARRVPGQDFEHLADCVTSQLARVPVYEQVSVAKQVVLDFAGEVRDIADLLHTQGRYATAFSLEGVAGRLIEALIVPEAPPAGARRPPPMSDEESHLSPRQGADAVPVTPA